VERRCKNGKEETFLLIWDPMHDATELANALDSDRNWQRIVKRGVHSLKKSEYQLVWVDECEDVQVQPLSQREVLEGNLKVIRSEDVGAVPQHLEPYRPLAIANGAGHSAGMYRSHAASAGGSGAGGRPSMHDTYHDSELYDAPADSNRGHGVSSRHQSEEEVMQEVMKASKAAADRDVMNEVKDSYEQALAEDRRREAQHHQSKAAEVQAAAVTEQEKAITASIHSSLVEEKRRRLPTPPAAGVRCIHLQLKLPGDKSLSRTFDAQDHVQAVYDFVDLETGRVHEDKGYALELTFPRKVLSDKGQLLAAVGLTYGKSMMVLTEEEDDSDEESE